MPITFAVNSAPDSLPCIVRHAFVRFDLGGERADLNWLHHIFFPGFSYLFRFFSHGFGSAVSDICYEYIYKFTGHLKAGEL